MLKIFQYSLIDLLKSKWTIIYFLFFMLISQGILWYSGDISKSIISLMNIILFITPLIGIMFGVIYYYNSSEFTMLLLAQPIKRRTIFLGQYLGLASSLSFSFFLGLLIPFAMSGVFYSELMSSFFILLSTGVFLTFIFSALSYVISLKFKNRLSGFGFSIMLWLVMAVIYDGLFMLLLLYFEEYPLENLSLGMTLLNSIDISRILIMLKLDISALMGYTGAVFNKFFGSSIGMIISFLTLFIWVFVPVFFIAKISKHRDF